MKALRKTVVFLMVALMVVAFCACGDSGSSESADSSPITEDEIAALYTDADSFTGRTFEFPGRVLDVEKDGGDLYLQVYQDITNYENNTVVVYPDADVNPKMDDFVRVKGTVEGTFSGENALGGDVEAPQITAEKVEIIDAMEAFPATKTVEVNQTVEKGSYQATVTKVDFTKDETRIYLTVKNGSSASFDNNPDMGVIVQNGKQYEAEWNEYYPEPSTELKAGASSESVIAFPKVEESDFTFSFEGYDADYNDLEFSFDITVE
ncbi:MAG: hypothetical protein K6B42_02865 [Clostridia bacterium]|nr:hypothetical protein [Clostridia bacterium]